MSENSIQPVPERGPWWFVWILCTVVVPAATFGLLAIQSTMVEAVWVVAALVVLVLHIVSSVKLGKGGSGWLTAGLIFGGWALMGVSTFVGCVVLLSRT